MKVSYESIIDCIIKHSIKILNEDYDNSEEIFNYAKPGDYPEQITALAENFGMMMVKLEARDFSLNQTIEKLRDKEQEIRQLYQAVVEVITAAIDARDSATAGHSKRVASYAVKFCHAINNINCGTYQFTNFSDNQIQECYYAALLHDVGKIGISEYILLKKQRLSDDRMSAIEYRLKYYKKCLELKRITQSLTIDEEEIFLNIENYYNFLVGINQREFILPEEEIRILKIANLEFINEDGTTSTILNSFEKENLIIRRGNLTDSEKILMNMHATYTADILKCLPWGRDMKKVAIIAAGHHEKIDGLGYPQGLTAENVIVQTRMLTIIDIFDALTAFDRPYKPPLSVDKALMILRDEANKGALDKELLEIFYDMIMLTP